MFNGAVTSARRNPRATFGLAAIVMSVSAVVGAVLDLAERSAYRRIQQIEPLLQNGQSLTHQQFDDLMSSFLGVLLPAFALTAIVSLVLTSALTGMLSLVIGRGILGRKLGLGEAWRAARLGAVVGTTSLLLLIAICVPLPVALVVLVLALLHLGPVAVTIGVLGGIASVIFEILLAVRLSLALPALMLERISPGAAIVRSFELSRGSFWRMLGILLVTEIVVGIAASLLSLPFAILGALAGGGVAMFGLSGGTGAASIIIGAVGGIVAATITRPVSAGVTVLLYADLRIRREGLDLALRGAAEGQALTGDEFDAAWRPPATGPAARPAAW